jgi:hypothetical protein
MIQTLSLRIDVQSQFADESVPVGTPSEATGIDNWY